MTTLSTLPSLLPRSAPDAALGDAATERSAAASDFDTFLTLLTAQLRNQDPMQPLDSTEFVAQLASFSTVEQVIGSNERLDSLIAATTSQETAGLATWLGADAADREGRIQAGEPPLSFAVPAQVGADTTEIVLFDTDGAERAILAAAPGERAEIDLVADGLALPGEVLQVRLRYRAGDTVLRETPATIFGRITAVGGDASGAILTRADGLQMRAEDVTALAHPR